MTQAELLRYLVDVLETLGVEYMIGGSHASMYYGEPRLTRDVDVIVKLRLGSGGDLGAGAKPGRVTALPTTSRAALRWERVALEVSGQHDLGARRDPLDLVHEHFGFA